MICLSPQVKSEDKAVPIPDSSTHPLKAEECRILEAHHPSADVAFAPGVAADGSPVAPADLPEPHGSDIPDVISFDLLLQPEGPGDLNLEGSAGVVSVDVVTGNVMLNGKPVEDGRAVVACEDLP